ncbi:MAG: hypothetical protein M1838_000466 [Thelocarpon superellum]|nr:MAG: hypothetical protein M1838_000466 [Thelocarpon superellum]
MANVGTTGGVAFGIADGVGGWADSGVDPSDFSHGICHHMATTASQYDDNRPLRAQALLQTGYVGVVKDPSIRAGGSTACVGVAHPDGVVEVANLGDSGFAQLRLNAVRHMSAPQTHAFNTPYQLSLIPPHVLAQSMVFGGRPWQDLPKDASVSRHDTRHGDVLVFATDGVWDNISPQQLLKMVSRCMQTTHGWRVSEQGTLASEDLSRMTQQLRDGPSEHPTLQSLLASTIAGEAKMASLNRRVDGPFAKEVQRLYPSDDYRGGKVDDICVVVAIVIANPDDLGASNT